MFPFVFLASISKLGFSERSCFTSWKLPLSDASWSGDGRSDVEGEGREAEGKGAKGGASVKVGQGVDEGREREGGEGREGRGGREDEASSIRESTSSCPCHPSTSLSSSDSKSASSSMNSFFGSCGWR